MKNQIATILVIAFLIVGCQPSESAIQTAMAETQAALPTATLIPTKIPTNTAKPTNTPKPTDTPEPTATNTPSPQPLTFTGSGDSVVDISTKWEGPALLHIIGPTVHDNFAVWTYDTSGDKDLIINTIGAYDGRIPIQLSDRDLPVVTLEIEAGGEWTVEILPISKEFVEILEAPGIFEGKGDNMIGVKGSASTITAKCNKDVNFAIWSYSATQGRDLLFNEIGPYEGTKVLPKDTFFLVIEGECDWSIELK
jgi:hypothetical protein